MGKYGFIKKDVFISNQNWITVFFDYLKSMEKKHFIYYKTIVLNSKYFIFISSIF